MDTCRIILLGPPQIEKNGKVTRFKIRKAMALVAYLVVEQRTFSREYLAALLWPNLGQKSAFANLRQTLSLLRGTFSNECIVTEGDQVQINRSLITVDIDEFHALLGPQSTETDISQLAAAADLYRGNFLEGFNLGNCLEYDEWQDSVRQRLLLKFDTLLETLSREYLRLGRPQPALQFALRWLALNQLNEAAHQTLMEIYARKNRIDLAHRQFKSCSKIFEREGLLPAERTRELHDAIVENRLSLSSGPVRAFAERLKHPLKEPHRLRRLILLSVTVVLTATAIIVAIQDHGQPAAEVFEVEIKYKGTESLDRVNPLMVYIGDITQHNGLDSWGEYTVTSEGTHIFPLENVPQRDNDGSGYFLLIIHDIGGNLEHPYYIDTDDVAGLYKEVAGNLVYGGFNVAGGSPVYPGERYSIEFSSPPFPKPDSYEMDNWDTFGTFLDYSDLPVRQLHSFHYEGSGDMDRDWFRVSLPAGNSVTVETFSADGQWEVDTAIDLCDSQMNYIKSSHDKTFRDNYSKLTYVNDTGADQVFHFLVKPYNQYRALVHKVGEYVVEIRGQE